MNYIRNLKRLSILEMIGIAIKKHPKKSIGIVAGLVVLLVVLSFTPHFIYLSKKNTANGYIKEANSILTKIDQKFSEGANTLSNNKTIYKEFEVYLVSLNKEKDIYGGLDKELKTYKDYYEKDKVKDILQAFDKKKVKENLIDKANNNLNQFTKVYDDIKEVKDINDKLITQEKQLSVFKVNSNKNIKSLEEKVNMSSQNGKTKSVKQNVQYLFDNVTTNSTKFDEAYNKIYKYNQSSQGTYNLLELRSLASEQSKVLDILNKDDSLNNQFNSYWNELHEQYYTIVLNDYSQRETDYVTEPNPAYREWTENEQYQDTETRYKSESYTERVYVGSRVVGDKKEDIYQTQTKTRQIPYQVPVTKTRSVKKTNGQPVTIPVPYDLYKFYYTVEKHTLNGTSHEDVYVGKKHEKYDSNIRNWNYNESEKEGYVVWKQLWNDNDGIKKGINIKAKLEG